MILLTGASGFIVKHLLKELIASYGKENVVALTSKPINDCNYLLHLNYAFGDSYFIESGIKNIDTIIHAGAFIPKSSRDGNNIKECNNNIRTTTRLTTSNLPDLKSFIFLSTIDVYAPDYPIVEDSRIDPVSLYGCSKSYCENLVQAWASNANINYQILRIGHVYGPGEEEYQKIIPITMKRLLLNKPIKLIGNGKALRSFIFITDVVEAIVRSLELKNNMGVINVVGQEQVSIYDLLHRIIEVSKRTVEIGSVCSNAISRDLIFDNSKMKQLLWTPGIDLKEGLQKEWNYMSNLF